jgi:urea transport system substrate-binding protein
MLFDVASDPLRNEIVCLHEGLDHERFLDVRFFRRAELQRLGWHRRSVCLRSSALPTGERHGEARLPVLIIGDHGEYRGRLNHVVRMAADEISKGRRQWPHHRSRCLDPASDWPLYAQVGKQMEQDKVAALFGCWTSVSRKSVLPVVERMGFVLSAPL